MEERELVIIDTNVFIDAKGGVLPDYRILKDLREGNNFDYGITINQLEDLAGSQKSVVRKYSRKFFDDILEKHNLRVLNVKKYKREYPMRKILIDGSRGISETPIEETDIRTVEIAIQNGAKYVVSNDEHISWDGINDNIYYRYGENQPIYLLNSKAFCEECCGELVDINTTDRLICLGKRSIRIIEDAFETFAKRRGEILRRQIKFE